MAAHSAVLRPTLQANRGTFEESAREWNADDAPRLGAALAFYTLLSLAPLSIAIVEAAYKPGTGIVATALGVITLMFGATSVVVELRDDLNLIWHVPLRLALARSRTSCSTSDRFWFLSF